MEKLCVLVIFALASSEVLCSTLRNKRQGTNNSNEPDNALDDRYGFDLNSLPGVFGRPPCRGVNCQLQRPQGPFQRPPQSTTTTAPGSSTTSATYQNCLQTCPVTPEYNPVCGSDNVTYDNPGRLYCAQQCGLSITLLRSSRCPTAAAAN